MNCKVEWLVHNETDGEVVRVAPNSEGFIRKALTHDELRSGIKVRGIHVSDQQPGYDADESVVWRQTVCSNAFRVESHELGHAIALKQALIDLAEHAGRIFRIHGSRAHQHSRFRLAILEIRYGITRGRVWLKGHAVVIQAVAEDLETITLRDLLRDPPFGYYSPDYTIQSGAFSTRTIDAINDDQVVHDLARQAVASGLSPFYSEEDLVDKLLSADSGTSASKLIAVNGEPVGFTHCHLESSTSGGTIAIPCVCVARIDSQRQGVGRWVLTELTEEQLSAGRKVKITVPRAATILVDLCSELGYKVIEMTETQITLLR
ncbi:MAG: hypothetical protein HY826_12220 [Actinobacteria bacterium]|nr:hypothetical protein [Actinomycetota bacterium]